MMRKFMSERGETLVETLISVLISALALLLLSTAIVSSVRIILASKDAMEQTYDDESSMIRDSGSDSSSIAVSFDVGLERDGEGNIDKNVEVVPHVSEKGDYAYYEKVTTS